MLDTIIFYVAFIGQIFLLSYYYPNIIFNRMNYVYSTYTPDKYPKLYPFESIDVAKWKIKSKLANYRLSNRLIIGLGVGLLAAGIINGYSPRETDVELLVVCYAMLQFLPIMLLELSEFKLMKIMREANSNGKRSTELKKRKLFDFVSPITVVAAVALIIANISFDLYVFRDVDVWKDTQYIKLISTNIVHVFFVGMIFWYLYGRKCNPLQTHNDRLQVIQTNIQSAVLVSMIVSIFFIINTLIDVLQMAYLDSIALSIYFQLIGMFGLGLALRSIRIEDINFEVYKADVGNVNSAS